VIALTVDKADNFVARLQRKGVSVRWDGWKMIFFKADKAAASTADGRFHKGQWGTETVIEPNAEGHWLVSYRLTRGANV
jgi:hypothetical protein